jgi:quercetin dioxygenase-like cupin family protein
MVNRGSIATTLGDAEITLQTGDAIQATLNLPHRIQAGPGEIAEVIAVFTRPISDYVTARTQN